MSDNSEAQKLEDMQALAKAVVALDRLYSERDEARAQLKAEQDAGAKLMQRFCKAMGTWEGPWDNAAENRLKSVTALRTDVEAENFQVLEGSYVIELEHLAFLGLIEGDE